MLSFSNEGMKKYEAMPQASFSQSLGFSSQMQRLYGARSTLRPVYCGSNQDRGWTGNLWSHCLARGRKTECLNGNSRPQRKCTIQRESQNTEAKKKVNTVLKKKKKSQTGGARRDRSTQGLECAGTGSAQELPTVGTGGKGAAALVGMEGTGDS